MGIRSTRQALRGRIREGGILLSATAITTIGSSAPRRSCGNRRAGLSRRRTEVKGEFANADKPCRVVRTMGTGAS